MEAEKGKLKVIGQLEAEPRLILPHCPLQCLVHFCTSQVATASCITGESAVCKMSFCLVLPFPFVSQDNKGWRLLYLPIFFQLVTHLLRCAYSHPRLPSMIPATSVTPFSILRALQAGCDDSWHYESWQRLRRQSAFRKPHSTKWQSKTSQEEMSLLFSMSQTQDFRAIITSWAGAMDLKPFFWNLMFHS